MKSLVSLVVLGSEMTIHLTLALLYDQDVVSQSQTTRLQLKRALSLDPEADLYWGLSVYASVSKILLTGTKHIKKSTLHPFVEKLFK